MLYPCVLCVALLMCLFVLCVACLTDSHPPPISNSEKDLTKKER